MHEHVNARDVMIDRLVTLKPEDYVLDACDRLIHNHITGAPVIDTGREFVGLFSEKCAMGLANLIVSRDGVSYPSAGEIMQRKLVTLKASADVFESIADLLKHKVSGAPVVDAGGNYLGIFSEKTSMSVVVEAAYEQLPTSLVEPFMNTDTHRIVSSETPLPALVGIFQSTPYRRLVVLDGSRLVGLISRRDVIRAVLPFLKKHSTDQMPGLEHTLPDATLTGTPVATFMDRNARTIKPELDLLSVAQIFLTTNYRRLPVLNDRNLVGQISRRDLLAVMLQKLAPDSPFHAELLYVSSLPPELRRVPPQ